MNLMESVETDAGLGYRTKDNINQPTGGLAFMSHGHFGSEVFDPMNPSTWLEINLCDTCLEDRREQGQVLHVTKAHQAFVNPVIYEKWNKFKHG